jgi:ligand-binding SRPBCC domain-containing protein
MKIYQLNKEQYLPISVSEAWAFFSSAKNLSKITPPGMKFHIRTDLKDGAIYELLQIEYTVRPVLNIPLHWVTGISKVNEPFSFTDLQLKGPYALWEHTHTFEQAPGGVKMTDQVRYALPLGLLGTLAHSIFVKQKLKNIFDFRERTLNQLFGKYMKP